MYPECGSQSRRWIQSNAASYIIKYFPGYRQADSDTIDAAGINTRKSLKNAIVVALLNSRSVIFDEKFTVLEPDFDAGIVQVAYEFNCIDYYIRENLVNPVFVADDIR